MNATGARSYHHGDLRNALILAAVEIIEESGSLNFSMADAARRAGVSSAAPYRHFRDRDALLDAVIQLAFLGLREVTEKVLENTRPGSAESIITMGHCYLDYLTARAAFYDLMWGDIGVRAMDQDNCIQRTSGFYHLIAAVEAYLQEHALTHIDARETATKLWALVHGFSALAMNGTLTLMYPQADVYALIDSATRSFLAGL